MKKHFLYLAMAALLFGACNKDEETTITKDSSKFVIEGYVIDGDGNVPMQDVEVVGAFGKATTDEKGFFKVSGLNHGTYSVIFQKENYGNMIQTFTLVANTTENQLDVDYTLSTTVPMFKMEKSMETTLWKVSNNKREVLANAPYTINLLSPISGVLFLNNKITGTTTAEGKIELSNNLPNSLVNIVVDYIDQDADKVYQLDVDVNPTTVAKSLIVRSTNLSDNLYVLNSNIFNEKGETVNDFNISESITIEFNQTLDDNSTATLENTTDDVLVATNISVNGNTITIDPVGDLFKTKNFKLSIKAYSGDNSLSANYVFSTEGAITSLAQVTGLSLQNGYKVYENSTDVGIEFLKVSGAQEYQLFGKYGDMTEFQLFRTVSANTDATVTRQEVTLRSLDYELSDMGTIPSSGMFADGKKFTIIVRAIANDGEIIGSFSTELAIAKNASY